MVVKIGSLELAQWGERACEDVCLRDLEGVLKWNVDEKSMQKIMKKVQKRREGYLIMAGLHIAWKKEKLNGKKILTVLVW